MTKAYQIPVSSCALIVQLCFHSLFGNEVLKRSKREVFKEDPLLTAGIYICFVKHENSGYVDTSILGLFEGDIAGVDIQTLYSVVNGTVLWPDSIPYAIDNGTGYVGKRAIAKAIAVIESKTCVRFRNATETDGDFILFVTGKGCYSYVGKQDGMQEVSIGDGCEQVGTVLHLLMHVLGFWHEESRLDRDLYILINWDNIETENAKHFEKYSIPRINVQSAMDPSSSAYDYESITHISPYAYSKDKSVPSILAKDERFEIGQRLDLSQNDVNAIVRAYCGQKQAGLAAADVMTMTEEEKAVYERTVQQQTGLDKEEQQVEEEGQVDESGLINPEQPAGCRDTSRKCPLWATQGLCYKNPTVMAVQCPGSCQACQMIATCDNFNSLCGVWAWLGNCVGKGAQKYLAACPLACGVCVPEGTMIDNETMLSNETTPSSMPVPASMSGTTQPVQLTTPPTPSKPSITCGDKHKNCQKWSSKGRCFYKHVQRLCPDSCNAGCDQPVPDTPTSKPDSRPPSAKTPTKICRDKRKNCAKFVPRGHCQRPGFQKQCELSCDMCEFGKRSRDSPVVEESVERISSEYCQDYSLSVCNGMQQEETSERCNAHEYIRRLCPQRCKMCNGEGMNSAGEMDVHQWVHSNNV